jgi:nonribosomal peptide synthetase CepB
VTQAVVVADQGRLVAYVVGGAEPGELRAWAAQRLPDYLVPAAVVGLDAVPLTVNGKLDRAALPRPSFVAGTAGRPPRGPAEERIAALFAETLDIEQIGAEDSFFDLGGDSIAAMRLTTLARAAGIDLRLRDLVSLRTVAALAEVTG